MTISRITSGQTAGTTDVNSFSGSASANAGDVIEVILQYRDNSSPQFNAPTWNGQTFTEIAARSNAAGFYYHRFYLIAAATATSNIASSTVAGVFTVLNWGYNVWRSSTNAFINNPFKTFTLLTYTSGGYSNPSIVNTVAANEVVSSFLCTPNWDVSFGTGTSSFTVGGSNVLIGSVTSTYVTQVKHLYAASTTATGSVTSSFTEVGTQHPMYQYSTAILYEALYLVSSINGGSAITYGQTGIAAVLTGFSSAITSITATYASGTKSVACTITGGTTNNPVFTIGDRVDGSDWPTDGTSLTFTFSDGTNTATGTQTFGKKAGEIKAPTWAGAVTSDLAYFSANLYADNFEVEGGEFIVKSPNLMGGSIGTLSADGGNGGTDAGVYDTWFIPASDKPGYTGRAGKSYFYRWTINDAGQITSNGGLTSAGLTLVGFTASGFYMS